MKRTDRFIQLHTTGGDPRWVNLDHVSVIAASLAPKGGSVIYLENDSDTFTARETPEQVVAIIRNLEQVEDTEGRPPPAVLPPADNLERQQVLVLSSRHLPDELIRRLDKAAPDYPFLADLQPGLLFSTVYAAGDPQKSLTGLVAFPFSGYLEPVRPVLLFALARGFSRALFDPDAVVVPELPVFEHR